MGDIKIGNSSITLKLGSADVSAAYIGTTLVYSGGTTPPTPTLQWVAFKDGADMTGINIYGIKGYVDDLVYAFEYTDSIRVYSLPPDYISYTVNIGNGCYTHQYGNENIELVFSDLGCNDYYTVEGLAQNWNNIYLLIEQ